jgi:hypothetical protein
LLGISVLPLKKIFQVSGSLLNLFGRCFWRFFCKVVQENEGIIPPVEEKYAVGQWPQFPQSAAYVLDLRLTDPGPVGFQSPKVRQYFPVPDAGVLVGLRLITKLNQGFPYGLSALAVFVKLHFKHSRHSFVFAAS